VRERQRRAEKLKPAEEPAMPAMTPEASVFYLTVFVLAVFVGYHVIWNVTPALHTPLMSLTNAISSIILVGAMLAAGSGTLDWGGWLGVVAVALVSINTFGGFLVTQRMLEMFRKKEPRSAEKKK
jgi:NAD(P) transhydrogenase subunit alpha